MTWPYYANHMTYLEDSGPWSYAWTIIAGMKGLHELRLTMSTRQPYTEFHLPTSALIWFGPLKMPKPRIYEVDFRFQPSDELLESLVDAPFSIKYGGRIYPSVDFMIAARLVDL